MTKPDVTPQTYSRTPTLTHRRPGERIADSASDRTTDTALGHSTFRTLEDASVAVLTDDQAASLGRLVRTLVTSAAGLPVGFDTVEDVCRSHLATHLAAATPQQTRDGVQRALDRLRAPAGTRRAASP